MREEIIVATVMFQNGVTVVYLGHSGPPKGFFRVLVGETDDAWALAFEMADFLGVELVEMIESADGDLVGEWE